MPKTKKHAKQKTVQYIRKILKAYITDRPSLEYCKRIVSVQQYPTFIHIQNVNPLAIDHNKHYYPFRPMVNTLLEHQTISPYIDSFPKKSMVKYYGDILNTFTSGAYLNLCGTLFDFWENHVKSTRFKNRDGRLAPMDLIYGPNQPGAGMANESAHILPEKVSNFK